MSPAGSGRQQGLLSLCETVYTQPVQFRQNVRSYRCEWSTQLQNEQKMPVQFSHWQTQTEHTIRSQ